MRTLVIALALVASSCARVRPHVTFKSEDRAERCQREADRAFRACLSDKTDRETCEDAQDYELINCDGVIENEREAITVKTTESRGHINVLRAYGVEAHRAFVIEYVNDTPDLLKKIRLECTLTDSRGAVVNVGVVELPEVAATGSVVRTVHVLDSVNRAAAGDCRVALAQK